MRKFQTLLSKLYRCSMHIGRLTGCHQMPERSFFIKEYQFPLCARCTGVVIGEILAIPIWLVFPIGIIPAIVLGMPLVIDGIAQYRFMILSTNPRRLITGILAGWGLISIYIQIFLFAVKLLG